MKKPFLNSLIFCLTISLIPAYCSVNRYDKLLERNQVSATQSDDPQSGKFVLIFEHEKFPLLDGSWLLTKTTKKRITNLLHTKPITHEHCSLILPYEQLDFKDSRVVISARGPDYFQVSSIFPVTVDTYLNPNVEVNKETRYENFGFKGVLDLQDITFFYFLKLLDRENNPSLSRQIELNGRLAFTHISPNKIIAQGYEMEQAVECVGYVMNEIELTFIREI